jgi:hypothetical protein
MAHRFTVSSLWGRYSAVGGSVVWLLLFLLKIGDSFETGLMQRILLLGILVIVPLALSLVSASQSTDDDQPAIYRTALIAQPFGAIGAVVSFLIDPGLLAAVLAFLWFCETALIASFGLWRIARTDLRSFAELSITAGLIFVPVAGVWMIVHRMGIQLMGYGDTIILLTAVHFHFAAYAAPILAGLAGRRLRPFTSVRWIFKLVPLGIIAGTPLVAAGISFSPVLALAGTALISLGLLLLSVLVLGWILPSLESIAGRVLLLISSVSCLPAMALACAYAYSIVFHKLIIDIPQMAMTHGVANAFGFSLCGLMGWWMVERKARQSGQHLGSQ